MIACAEWLWSGYPVKYPSLKIAMSEGGIGWVAMILDRLDNITDRGDMGLMLEDGDSRDRSNLPFPDGFDPENGLRPAEVLKRNFWFCTIDDPSTIDTRNRIGTENIMLEVDYPHSDTTWPNTQAVIEKAWGHLAGRGPAKDDAPQCGEFVSPSAASHMLPVVGTAISGSSKRRALNEN